MIKNSYKAVKKSIRCSFAKIGLLGDSVGCAIKIRFDNPKKREEQLAEWVTLLPSVTHWPQVEPERLIVFVSGDAGYFKEHGVCLVRSLYHNSPESHVHAHVINPTVETESLVLQLQKERCDGALSYTSEQVDFSNTSEEFQRTYYACIRFVRLYQLLIATHADILLLDIDSIVRKSFKSLKTQLSQYDCGLYDRFEILDRRLRFNASSFYICPTERGKSFLRDMALLISRDLVEKTARWFLDQKAMYHAYQYHCFYNPPIRFYSFATFLDWDFKDTSSVWTGKGQRKFEDEQYLAYRALFLNPL